jgi:hypothetical protein
MANPLTGKNGRLGVGAGKTADNTTAKAPTALNTAVSNMVSWEVTSEQDLVGIAEFGDEADRFKATLSRWSGRATGQWAVSTGASNQDEISGAIDELAGGTESLPDSTDKILTMEFWVDGESARKLFYYGLAHVRSQSIRTPVDGVVEIDYDLQGHGVLAFWSV